MGRPIDRVTIAGFKSIETLDDFPLKSLNVLIGANGAGKSNFVDFFRMLRSFADEGLQRFILDSGGGDGLLFLGPKVTPEISARLVFGDSAYEFRLKPTASGSLQVSDEIFEYLDYQENFTSGSLEATLKQRKDDNSKNHPGYRGIGHDVYEAVSNWTVYHFHDTSPLSPMRRDQPLHDDSRLRHDASNIAPFLSKLSAEAPGSYELICETVRLIAPFFDDFLFRPRKKGSNELLRLEWRQKGTDFPFQPSHLSDGTIRFICLAVSLLQPAPPDTIVIDEPELGLHPYALSILADLVKSASERTQVIISTQSPTLLDYFQPTEIVVVNRRDGRSIFERLDAQSLTMWLDDYSVGELWQKNVVHASPTYE
jgi:predicted ATPase